MTKRKTKRKITKSGVVTLDDDRNPRREAEHLAIDMSQSDVKIQRALRARYPRVVDLWWELEPDQKSGWVYSHNRVLAKLVHVRGAEVTS